ncbi:MAG: hypothetical protein HY079_08940, partial [Elusimicrobia bacterium]|nr:hypothetical protein [Elusimicrobiota bacterium]
AAAVLVLLPRAVPGVPERVPAALGALAAAAALTAAGAAAASAGRRALDKTSESRAPELFERRRRLAATVLLIVSGVGLSASLSPR